MLRRLMCASCLCLLAGCVEAPTTSVADESVTPDEVRQQPLLDDGAPNWMVVGGAGNVEMVGGSDGEPNELTGRFALDGSVIVDAVSGTGRWVVVSANQTQALDDDALRLAEGRDALSGDTIAFVAPSATGWLIGGANGRVQTLDAQGEPTPTMAQLLGNADVTAGAFNGTNWLVGSAAGNVVAVNDALAPPANPDGQVLNGGAAVTAIIAEPTTAALDPPWLAFTATDAVAVSGTGVPQTPVQVLAAGSITTAAFGDNKAFIGTSDGRVGVADYNANPNFSFTNVVGGATVTRLVSNGSDWIALGANGQAQRLDANGATLGPAVQITTAQDRPLVGAHWTGSRWLVVVAEIGFVAFVDDQLAAPRALVPVLDGATIRDASASTNGDALVVGDGGRFQRVDDLGVALGGVSTLTGGPDLRAAEWNGDAWLVAGSGGSVQLIDADGSPVGSVASRLNGQDIEFAAWSGEFFLIGGAGGMVQTLLADGSASGSPFQVAGATQLYDARWSGLDWLVVGTDGTAGAFARLQTTDIAATATIVADTGALRAVDFNGIEFLAGGDGGLIQRVSGQGQAVEAPISVLSGFTVYDLTYNGTIYIVVGEYGAVRRLGQDYVPLRTSISVLDRRDAHSVIWTAPRGFARGPCLTDELCYAGPCVGGLAAGRCCDAACDRPCESCFQDDTAQPDGTCAPVVAGKQPPPREGSAGCERQSEATCGLTGACDGGGECAFYGADIECGEPVCSLGRFTPIATCTGTGTCEDVAEIDCSPYVGCTIDGCVTTCTANQDCVDGFVCDDGMCVEEDEPIDDQPTEQPEDDGGCCATMTQRSTSSHLLLLLAGVVITVRRRRRR